MVGRATIIASMAPQTDDPSPPFTPPLPVGQDLHPGEKQLVKWVAIISALAALLGAMTGALGSWVVSNNQIESSRQQDVQDFRREQRKEVYADYLAAVNDLAVRSAGLSLEFNEINFLGVSSQFTQRYLELLESSEEHSRLSASVGLVGSNDVNRVVAKIVKVSREAGENALFFSLESDKPLPDQGTMDQRSYAFNQDWQEYQGLIDEYLVTAKADLDLGD